MRDYLKNRFSSAERVILYTGILLIVLSFISEFNFHYIQGFSPDLVEFDIFWRAEAAEVFNSMSFLILGVILIIIAFYLSKKKLKVNPTKILQ
ncbi:MAG: hypothetical protein ACFFD7_13600 [Candidatus Thorarchaeota archaeon]